MVNYYNHQQIVAENLRAFMQKNGYSKLSLSKLSDVPRPAIDQLLLTGGENIDISIYNTYILQINRGFNFAENDLLKVTPKPNLLPPPPLAQTERSALAQELLDGLDHIMDIYTMYIS
ncbi:hypothetical protein [Paenibacillus polymyxa]|uniref:hypothetical protein n=1 Tax=Paenibacillus polymyxa TaxID=1406 RepID=UPI002378A154|nr:hypothetical protein [Paenibacillus polymyxa]WDM21289.1 hypothetical protein J4I02_20340 [Paenibacillus polymyxa]